MPERGEMGMPEMLSSREVQALIEKAKVIKAKLEILADDPAIREGAEASLRTAINTAIAVADMFPGVGMAASWGADAAKVWARFKYMEDRAKALAEGKDPSKVKMSPVDLTPDVSVEVALGTELLELVSMDMMPTHAIESAMQLKHDLPRIKKAAKKLRDALRTETTVKPDEAAAAETFGVTL